MIVADVSENQGVLDWPQIKTTPGLIGVYVKLSEGRDYDDIRASFNLHGAAQHGLLTGVYHFARPDRNPPAAEAAHFLRRIRAVGATSMPPVLDFETRGHVGEDNPVAWARAFNRVVHEAGHGWPIFYSYTAFIAELAPATPIGGGLWLANYGANDGREHVAPVPHPWRRYLLHQYTSRGTVRGYGGHVDLSSVSAPFARAIGAAV